MERLIFSQIITCANCFDLSKLKMLDYLNGTEQVLQPTSTRA